MATKTFKVGEVAIGGIIKVTSTKKHITVEFRDWDTKKVIKSRTFQIENARRYIDAFVCENASIWLADKINDWCYDKVEGFESSFQTDASTFIW